MPTRRELLANARGKLKDTKILYDAKRYDSSYYLCGYAVEMALKARIVKHLKLTGWPPDSNQVYNALKRHDLDYLLNFTGLRPKIKLDPQLESDFSEVLKWKPDQRYSYGVITKSDVEHMLASVKSLYGVIKR